MQHKLTWPNRDAITAEGCMMYHESAGSWNTVRLSQRIVWEFPLLMERGKKVGYKAVLARTAEKMEEMIAGIRKGELPPPLLLFFFPYDE